MKPAIAHWLVRTFSDPGMRVIDPLGGVGTIAFEACLQGRVGVTNDLSPLAATVAQAKVQLPQLDEVKSALQELEGALHGVELMKEDLDAVKFGLNASVADYYHPRTLVEILKARRFYLDLGRLADGHAFVKASLLHVLHGNRPYALSRTSHPLTPFHPSGEKVYKSLARAVRNRCKILKNSPRPSLFRRGESYDVDFRDLPRVTRPGDLVLSSPPFIGLRFDRPNWLRLWFCGWEAEDFWTTSRSFVERQQLKSMDVYDDFFLAARLLLKSGGTLVMHVGGSRKYDMATVLVAKGSEHLDFLDRISEDVQRVEKHGVTDKGATTTHEFLFFRKQ